MLALGQQPLQHALHPSEVAQLRLDLHEPVGRDAPDGTAVDTVLKLQQLGDFFQ